MPGRWTILAIHKTNEAAARVVYSHGSNSENTTPEQMINLIVDVYFLYLHCIQTRYILSCLPLFTCNRLSIWFCSSVSPALVSMYLNSSGKIKVSKQQITLKFRIMTSSKHLAFSITLQYAAENNIGRTCILFWHFHFTSVGKDSFIVHVSDYSDLTVQLSE